jgi:Flp pilus assembly protein TadD
MIERDKHNWLAFGNLGTEYAEKGDYTNALVNYKKALDIMPNEPLLIQNAVRLQYNNNNPVGAMNTMLHGKVIVLQPGNTVGH